MVSTPADSSRNLRAFPEKFYRCASRRTDALFELTDAILTSGTVSSPPHLSLAPEEIAPIVGRSPNAAKMLASRARRRVQEAATVPETDIARQREVVDAFLAASRNGEFDALLAVLDPDVVLRADRAAVQAGASREVRGARAVADTFLGRARAAQPALANGAAEAVWAPGGRPRVVFGFTITGDKIVEIDILADPARLRRLDLAVLDD
jgi:hypothetical protein